MKTWKLYLSGEIHTGWREEIEAGASAAGLPVETASPVTHHEASDDCGVAILGAEPNKFWHDHKGAQMNAIRTRTLISEADIVVVRFGEMYKQWNAAFDAGYCAALGTPYITLHDENIVHPILVYADLIASGDKRNIEIANMIYEREIIGLIRED